MKMHTQKQRPTIALFAATVLVSLVCGCPLREAPDKPLELFQAKLLDLAFETATAIPADPHIKDRSKAQESVVLACFELDQPKRSDGYIEKIDNWVKGSCYADLAYYCGERGYRGEAKSYIGKASKITETADDWRKDRIKAKIVKAQTLLDQKHRANDLAAKTSDSGNRKASSADGTVVDEKSFDDQMKQLSEVTATGDFDTTRSALEAYTQLFKTFYENTERRSLLEESIKASWSKQPIFVRMNILMELAGCALDRADSAKALQLLNETQQSIEGSQWNAEDRIPLAAKLAALRFRAGDTERARSDADAVLAFYNSNQSQIVNIWRAGALRPLAKTYKEMGDAKAALTVYKLAIKEGIENPNSRPRAEDLAATCSSMALTQVEPDAELWTEIQRIREGLGKPW